MKFKYVGLLITAFILLVAAFFNQHTTYKSTQISPTSKPNPTINPINQKVIYPEDYTFVLVGDSMTAALGNSDELRSYLSKYYPGKTFEFLNYGFGSTNILSIEDRLTKTTNYGRDFRPILDIDFDIILIESMGNNPLSQFPLEEGLKQQTQALERIVDLIKTSNPRAPIVFVATIAPNSQMYAKGQADLSPEVREKWVAERNAYIKNHIDFAKSHNLPLINIYEKSLKNGDGNLDYIDKTSYIHPSPNGVIFISQEIADYLYHNKILDNIKKTK